MTETAQTPPAQLVDKKGRALKGAARVAAEIKQREGKGHRPPQGKRAAAAAGDIAASRTSSTTTTEPKKKSGGLISRLARIW